MACLASNRLARLKAVSASVKALRQAKALSANSFRKAVPGGAARN
jgi:hypothetical protein